MRKYLFVIIFISIFSVSCSPPEKPIGWTQLHPSNSPPPLNHSGFAYDKNSKEAVIFGGLATNKWSDETWIWNGNDWHRAKPPTHPSAREKTAMAYDEFRDKIVLFGGSSNNTVFGDTWEWNGYHWEWIDPPISPPARCCHALAYDSTQNKVLLYGGWDPHSGEFFKDTWVWDGQEWTDVSCCNSPGASGHTLVNLSVRNEILALNSVDYYGTWIWNGQAWQNPPIDLPPVRQDGRLVYDEGNNRAILFGGIHEGENLNDTRIFDEETWNLLNLPISPPARSAHVMFYDSQRQSIIMFGGYGSEGKYTDTWELYLPEDLSDLLAEEIPLP